MPHSVNQFVLPTFADPRADKSGNPPILRCVAMVQMPIVGAFLHSLGKPIAANRMGVLRGNMAGIVEHLTPVCQVNF